MKLQRLFLLLTAMFCFHITAMAQNTDADFMRSMGKMYVVVAVVATIFVGIVLYLVFLDRRLTNIENQIKENG